MFEVALTVTICLCWVVASEVATEQYRRSVANERVRKAEEAKRHDKNGYKPSKSFSEHLHEVVEKPLV